MVYLESDSKQHLRFWCIKGYRYSVLTVSADGHHVLSLCF